MHEASRSTNADDEHDPEGSTIAYERAQLEALADATRVTRDGLRDALRRMDTGEYGVCTVCGAPIPAARLAVRPQATACVEHASVPAGWIGAWSRSSRGS
ncbi:MAG: putative DNA-binding protein [Nocardioidaceae bacterium]|nr:putative DNA-binding protein [Nocardioidaceae bacterium]